MSQRACRFEARILVCAGLALLALPSAGYESNPAGDGSDEARPAGRAPDAVGGQAAPVARPPKTPPAGLRVVRDPETGQLVANPGPELRQRLAIRFGPGLERSFAGLEPFALDQGGRGVNLQGRFMSTLAVERGPDGNLRMRCGDDTHGGAPHVHPLDGADRAPHADAALAPGGAVER
jgi:hypothetical protein